MPTESAEFVYVLRWTSAGYDQMLAFKTLDIAEEAKRTILKQGASNVYVIPQAVYSSNVFE